MPVNNLNEKKVNVWEIPEFQASYVLEKISEMVRGELPNNVADSFDLPEYGNDGNKITELLSATNQIDPENGVVYGMDRNVHTKKTATSEEEIKEINDHLAAVKTAALNQASKRGDKRIKQYYEDAAFLVDRTKGNITESFFTSPYINTLMAQRNTLVIPTEYSSAEQKRGLTVPLYEALYDFQHATVGEIAVDYRRQEYEKKGWNKENTAKYLAELHQAHSRVLYQFNKLSKFRDDPQNNTDHYTQDGLRDAFGTGQTGRTVTHGIGIIRGEKKAIENGWGKDELFILGMLGGIEEAMKTKSAVNRSENFKDSYPQFKADFTRLKNECFYSTVSTPAEKLAIADKIKNFLDTQKSVAAESCFSMVNDVRGKFDQVYNNIADGIKMIGPNYANVNPNKNGDTAGYLKGLFEEGMESGTYSIFVSEYIDAIVKAANSPNPAEASTAMSNVIIAVGDKDNDVIKAFTKQALISYFDLTLACASEEEQLAEDIRAGRVKVEDNVLPFKGAHKDVVFSKKYAKHLLINSDLHQKQRAAREICRDICHQKGIKLNSLVKMKEEYVNNSLEGLDELQVDVILKDTFIKFNKSENKIYNVTRNVKAAPKEFALDEKDFVKNINSAKSAFSKYSKKQTQLVNRLADLRTRAKTLANYKPTAIYDKANKRYHRQDNPDAVISPKNANSQTFMNLLNAMDKVEKLNASHTPNQVLEAYRNLRDAAKAYNDKIDSHTFAGRRENGKQRRALSGEVYDFAKTSIQELELKPNYMDMNVSMNQYSQQLDTVTSEVKSAFRNEELKKLDDERKNCIETCFEYNEQSDFLNNKNQLMTGMAKLLTIRTLNATVTDNYGTVIAPSQISKASIDNKAKIFNEDPVFQELKESITTELQVKNMMQKMKDNPGSVYEEYNKFTPEYKASMAAFEKSKANNNLNKQKENNNIEQQVNNNLIQM